MDMDEIEEIFYDIEEINFNNSEHKKPNEIIKKSVKKEIKRNKLGLTPDESSTLFVIIFAIVFITLFVSGMCYYCHWYMIN